MPATLALFRLPPSPLSPCPSSPKLPCPAPAGSATSGPPSRTLCLAALSARGADPKTIVFNQTVATQQWTLKELNPDLPSDWTGYDFLVLEFRASSSQRFELGLQTADQLISKRIHPFPGVWVRAAIPLRFYRRGWERRGPRRHGQPAAQLVLDQHRGRRQRSDHRRARPELRHAVSHRIAQTGNPLCHPPPRPTPATTSSKANP